jgi:hypothetical protein
MLISRLYPYLVFSLYQLSMARALKQAHMGKLRIAAELAKFAYTSTSPEMEISTNDTMAQESLVTQLETVGLQPAEVLSFKRYHSRPWFTSDERKFRWFRSHSYFVHFRTLENVDKIIVGFRGTWYNPSGDGTWFSAQSTLCLVGMNIASREN